MVENLVAQARQSGASDIHLEPGMPVTFRIRGELRRAAGAIPGKQLLELARVLVGDRAWPGFVERQSADLSRTISGTRCRASVFRTRRGVGVAMRLLSGEQPTLSSLNLHPELEELTRPHHGLVIVCGPTGAGKSSTLAALLHSINEREARHIVTIERPIEYEFQPRRSFVRQREVGRHTPSFQRGLRDALREDPDVLMVGEMLSPKTMRLTLNVAETGHLVFTSVHSSSCAEALQRISSSFPSSSRAGVRAQLADVVSAVVCQRMTFHEELGIRVPELEIVRMTTPIKSLIRQGQFFKLGNSLETGRQDGQWSFGRYRHWLSEKVDWEIPDPVDLERAAAELSQQGDQLAEAEAELEVELEAPERPAARRATPDDQEAAPPSSPPTLDRPARRDPDDVIVIEPPSGSLSDILSELEDRPSD